jgi:hypothetical protein
VRTTAGAHYSRVSLRPHILEEARDRDWKNLSVDSDLWPEAPSGEGNSLNFFMMTVDDGDGGLGKEGGDER